MHVLHHCPLPALRIRNVTRTCFTHAPGQHTPPHTFPTLVGAQEYYLPGAHAARMLHRARRAERMLMSYERTGAPACLGLLISHTDVVCIG